MHLNFSAYKGILFDFDGVLADTCEDNYRGWRYAFGEQGIDLDRERYLVLEGHTVEEIASILLSAYGKPTALAGRVWEDKEKFFRANVVPKLFPQTLPLLKELGTRGIKRGVVSGGKAERLKNPIFSVLFALLDTIVTGDDVTKGKPWPEPYLKGAERLGLEPRQCLVVENAPPGIAAARAAGMDCVALTTSLRAELLSGANLVLGGLQDLQVALLA